MTYVDRLVRWRPSQYAEIQRVAAALGLSANAFIRQAVLRELMRQGPVQASEPQASERRGTE